MFSPLVEGVFGRDDADSRELLLLVDSTLANYDASLASWRGRVQYPDGIPGLPICQLYVGWRYCYIR